LIRASELHKHFGDNHAVDGISLQVHAGEIYGLVGADGAGKTTTIRLLVGALRADKGEASICGLDIRWEAEQARTQLGYLSQRFSLYDDLTVLENIRFFAEVRGLPKDEWLPRCMEILEFVGLANFSERRAGQLSGGMKQKLGLATALVTQPRVLLLDEPTTGVDPVTRQDFWQLLVRLVSHPKQTKGRHGAKDDEGVAVLISTPYMDEASRCSRIGFMRQGKLIAEGTPSQLRDRLSGRVLVLRGSPLDILRRVSHEDVDVEDVQAFGDRLHLRVVQDKADDVIRRLRDKIKSINGKVDELRTVSPVLEDVFIALSGAQATHQPAGESHE